MSGRMRSLAPVDRRDLSGTRWRAPKDGLLRVLRLVTAPQAAFNHAAVDELEDVRAELAACRRELADTQARVRRLEHAVLAIHGPLLVDLVDRAGGLLAPDAAGER